MLVYTLESVSVTFDRMVTTPLNKLTKPPPSTDAQSNNVGFSFAANPFFYNRNNGFIDVEKVSNKL